jgi:hypothetical protein
MSEQQRPNSPPDQNQHELDQNQLDQNQPAQDETPRRGVNLTLIYGLIALAMLVAIAVAALIVLPFYNRR